MTSVLVRAGAWILLGLFFLVRDVTRMQAAHASGRPVTVWMVLQFALWLVVIGFWSFAAWRGWSRRSLR